MLLERTKKSFFHLKASINTCFCLKGVGFPFFAKRKLYILAKPRKSAPKCSNVSGHWNTPCERNLYSGRTLSQTFYISLTLSYFMGSLKTAFIVLVFLLVLGFYLYPDMTKAFVGSVAGFGKTITGYAVSFIPK